MPRPPPAFHPRAAGVAILAGVAVGTAIVLIIALSFSAPFRLAVSPARSGSLKVLDCSAGQCVNVTIRFSGVSSVNPLTLRISVLPYTGTEIVNHTVGAPLNLAYFATASPRWVGNLGGGTYTESFVADMVNPDGQLIGQGGPSTIASGAVLCLKDNATGPNEEYGLAFSYMGAYVAIPFVAS